MSIDHKVEFEIVIDARQGGTSDTDRWNRRPLTILSRWEPGTDQEKFEVLSEMRRTYNPDAQFNIRGRKRENPEQVARLEGFTDLRYRRIESPLPVTIVRHVAHRAALGWVPDNDRGCVSDYLSTYLNVAILPPPYTNTVR